MTFYRISVLAALALLGGCASLPSSGPTGSEIVRSARDPKTGTEIKVVPLTDFSAVPLSKGEAGPQLAALEPPPTDMVGPGDVLDIAIYEAGVTLFSGNSRATAESAAFDPAVKSNGCLRCGSMTPGGSSSLTLAGSTSVATRLPK